MSTTNSKRRDTYRQESDAYDDRLGRNDYIKVGHYLYLSALERS